MNLTIGNEEVELRFTFDAFTEYEKLYNEPFGSDNQLDKAIVFMYLVILCSKKGWQNTAWLSYEDFREWLNDDPERFITMTEWIAKNMDMNSKLMGDKKK